jgi:hypothetical protein
VGTLWYRRRTAMRMSGLDLRATKTQLSQALGPWIQVCCTHRSVPPLRRFAGCGGRRHSANELRWQHCDWRQVGADDEAGRCSAGAVYKRIARRGRRCQRCRYFDFQRPAKSTSDATGHQLPSVRGGGPSTTSGRPRPKPPITSPTKRSSTAERNCAMAAPAAGPSARLRPAEPTLRPVRFRSTALAAHS